MFFLSKDTTDNIIQSLKIINFFSKICFLPQTLNLQNKNFLPKYLFCRHSLKYLSKNLLCLQKAGELY